MRAHGVAHPTRYLRWAIEDGLGVGDLERIEVRGSAIAELRRPFMLPADELRLMWQGLEVYDGDACSGCRVAALSALHRYAHQRRTLPVRVMLGREGAPPAMDQHTLVVGRCASERCEPQPCSVGGCPPSTESIMQTLERMGCACTTCRDLTLRALEGCTSELLANLRVAAAGAEVHLGSLVRRDARHLELLVGECSWRYARAVLERAAQFGMSPETDIMWLPECPASEEDIAAALARLVMVRVGVEKH